MQTEVVARRGAQSVVEFVVAGGHVEVEIVGSLGGHIEVEIVGSLGAQIEASAVTSKGAQIEIKDVA